MPYKSKKDLPKRVKDNLPKGAQTIFKEAFNQAYKNYKKKSKRQGLATREETASRVAWSAVKKKYRKKGDKWVKKS